MISWSEVHIAPERFPAPYLIAYVRLEDGPLVVARLAAEADDSLTGCRVRLVLEDSSAGAKRLLGVPLSEK